MVDLPPSKNLFNQVVCCWSKKAMDNFFLEKCVSIKYYITTTTTK